MYVLIADAVIALELVRRVNLLLFGIMIMGHAAKKNCEITEISFFEHEKCEFF